MVKTEFINLITSLGFYCKITSLDDDLINTSNLDLFLLIGLMPNSNMEFCVNNHFE